jgi:hypothetical protein
MAKKVKNRLSRLDGYAPELASATVVMPEIRSASEEKSSTTTTNKIRQPHAFTPFADAVTTTRSTLTESNVAFLRHSWNRLDSIAVVAFWISFVLALTGLEPRKGLYVFRALSVLRGARLLTVTKGTSVCCSLPF